ncbi:hypothetical protein FRC02_001751 [Tulasnella sp. 418]|nr:hypothetical protein FRC02_001751 [Tulasnella sp. 418]
MSNQYYKLTNLLIEQTAAAAASAPEDDHNASPLAATYHVSFDSNFYLPPPSLYHKSYIKFSRTIKTPPPDFRYIHKIHGIVSQGTRIIVN